MATPPAGTVTLVVTDLEASTALLQRLGDRRYADILAEHRRLLRDAFAAGNGREVDTQGDAFLVAFASARDAVATAIAAQRTLMAHAWPEGATLRVRMGLHTGEPVQGPEGYAGLDVHRAARICAAGHGGQILVSDSTHALVAKDPPEGVSFRDLGEHRLKDLTQPLRLFQVVAAGLALSFPPLKSLDDVPSNLPVALTSFIGRERETAEVTRLLLDRRLLTLTGAGGCGKSRLALEVARGFLGELHDGVWVVELAALSDPTLVPHAAAAVLRVPEQSGRTLVDTLMDALRQKSLLVVLDNCEHLLTACTGLADALLRRCPGVRILATSREALGVAGETIWRVPSLSAPDPVHLPPHDRMMQFEAVRLFAERAAAVRSGFQVTRDNARVIAEACRRLDGIPLALELAAARARALSVEQIAARLDDRFRLLTGGSPTVLPRQRTLRAAMDWSYDLLTERERVLLARLSVFAGGWTLEAAEAVCAGDGLEAPEILDLLTSLVDKSLVLAEIQGGEARYGLLETVRQYGRERLHEAGTAESVRGRHRDWYLALAERAGDGLDGPEQKAWLDRLETEHDNLRTALEHSRGLDDGGERGLRLAVTLRRFWEIRAYFAEGRAWLEGMIAAGGQAPPALRSRALTSAGILAYRQGDYQQVFVLCSEGLSIAEAHSDASASALALHFLAHVRQAEGAFARATEMMERSVALYQEAGNRRGIANSVDCLGELARMQRDYGRAAALTQQALALYGEIGDDRGKAHVLHNLAYIRLRQNQTDEARDLFRQSLILTSDLRASTNVMMAVAGLAAAWVGDVPPERIARLLGAVGALLTAKGAHLEPAEQMDFEHTVASMRARLGDQKFSSAWDSGRAMTSDEAVEEAMALAATSATIRRSASPTTPLTARECEVAALVAQGLSNREIASRLVIAERTAEGHVQSILNKLGFNSRAQIAAWAVERGLRIPSA
ncbi:MAG TPA: LuxR C-terminal-related transcriptional regulator [bacterium]|nr:LuxR C-terminal-related transcriptional regulator [bacterium]